MHLFFTPQILKSAKEYQFDKNDSIHIIKVLRKKIGDFFYLTDGMGTCFYATISEITKKSCCVTIEKWEEKVRSRDYYLHIAIAPTKSITRLEWFIEKSTEVGVDEITPIYCEHSERRVLKTDRILKVSQAAAKQSFQFYFPKINSPSSFEEFIEKPFSGQKFIAHCNNTERSNFIKKVIPSGKILVLIGPEGDFSNSEIALSSSKGFLPISLGDQRLRTETAGLLAVCGVNSKSFI